MATAYEMTLCTRCNSWIDEGEEIFWDSDGDIVCSDCK